jgi:hypothetical protein
MKKRTQNNCKMDFAAAMVSLAHRLEQIDKSTPHSEVEPEWWLRMMEMRRTALNYARQYGDPEKSD